MMKKTLKHGCVKWMGALCIAAAIGCGKMPQLGDDECFSAADALWTAITAQDAALLDQCERELRQLNAKGRLAGDAHARLQRSIDMARKGNWRPATEELDRLVKAQRKIPGKAAR